MERDKVYAIFAPLLYVDYYRPAQTMNFERMSEKHWQLYYTCWKHNVKEFQDKIWLATQNFGLVQRLISAFGAYAIGVYLLRFFRDQYKRKFGDVPSWMG